MKIYSLSLALCLSPLSLSAKEAPASAPSPVVEKLMAVINTGEASIQAAMTAFKPTVDNLRKNGMPAEGCKEAEAVAEKFFRSCFTGPEFNNAIAAIYQKHFTQEELQATLEFYQTPVGKKSLKLVPQIMAEAGVIGQQIAQSKMNGFKADFEAVMGKYKKQMANPAPAGDDEAAPQDPAAE